MRDTQRKARRRAEHPLVALVGYTNAGKSTLLNRLTGAGVLVEDRLFSTLDATIRRLALPGGETVLLSDTVGFVRKLPHQLVESFRSTLEEVVDADLLVHVVDASSPEAERQIDAVRAVLRELGAGEIPELLVANKLDVADPEVLVTLKGLGAVPVSAVTGEGTDGLPGDPRRAAPGPERRRGADRPLRARRRPRRPPPGRRGARRGPRRARHTSAGPPAPRAASIASGSSSASP